MPLTWFFLSVALPGESITFFFFFFFFLSGASISSMNQFKDSNPRENQFTDGIKHVTFQSVSETVIGHFIHGSRFILSQ